jgi:hypothetical protein
MNAIDSTTAGTQNGILSAGGGNVGGTMQALLSAQRNAGDAQNQVLANGEQQNNAVTGMYGELLNKVAARKMQLQLMQHDELMAQWAQKNKAGMSNLMAGMASTSNSLNHEKDQPPQEQPTQQVQPGSFNEVQNNGSAPQTAPTTLDNGTPATVSGTADGKPSFSDMFSQANGK